MTESHFHDETIEQITPKAMGDRSFTLVSGNLSMTCFLICLCYLRTRIGS